MSGYRDSSSFEPYASPRYGKPLRPFNWVQRTGLALVLAAVAFDLAFVGGSLGWWRKLPDTPVFAITPLMFGLVMINSRREPIQDIAPELAAARRKWLAITVAVCAAILGIATIFALKGF